MVDLVKFYIFLFYAGLAGKILGIGFQAGKIFIILIGALLTSYLSFLPYITLNSTVFFVIISLPIALILLRKKPIIEKEDVISEIIFIVVFLFSILVRIYSPNIIGAEKPMEFAFINSIARTSHLPPYDPWLLGYANPYYYFGFIPIVLIAKLLFIQNAVIYNLYSCFIFAITASIIFEMFYKEKKHIWMGITGVIIVNFMANYERIVAFFRNKKLIDYWASSRVIPNTINEFPLFSFIHGDNHPHYLFLPLSIIGIYLIWKENKILLILFSIFIFIINPWSLPFFLFLWISKKYIENRYKIIDITYVVLSYIIAFILSIPFLYTRGHTPLGIGIVPKGSDIIPLFIHFGPFILLTFTMLKTDDLINIIKYAKRYFYIIIISIILIIFRPSLILGIFILTLYVLIKEERDRERKFFLMLLAYSYLVILGCEVIYIKDIYAYGSFFRGNTVFKFYYLSWISLGVSVLYLNFIKRTKISIFLMTFIIIPALLYLPLGIMGRIDTHFSPTLDGIRFLKHFHPTDFDIINYINKNIKGHPGIVEAIGKQKAYTYYGRISTYTGLPTILGWSMHELIWRGYVPEKKYREKAITTLYTGKMKEKEDIILKYQIKYMVIGELEKIKFKNRLIYPENTDKIKIENIKLKKGTLIKFIY